MIYVCKLLTTVLSTYVIIYTYWLLLYYYYYYYYYIIIASTRNWGRVLDKESCPDVTENTHPAGDHGSQH